MNYLKRLFTHPLHSIAGLIRKLWFLFPNDKGYLKIVYFFEMGRKLNLKHPTKFTEKLQWLKLYERKDEYTQMVDKISAKEYVSGIIGLQHIIPTLGVWDKFEEIDFSLLPKEFVLKTNHGGGSSSVVICRDKNTFDYDAAKKKLERGLKKNPYNKYREWPYRNITPKIFAETFITNNKEQKKDIIDYKWYCFNGNPMFCQVIQDRSTNETIDFFDSKWNHLPFVGLNPVARNSIVEPNIPEHLGEMLKIAQMLSNTIPFCRIDLYDINNTVYFGEITFYPASGFGRFTPGTYDEILGRLLQLPEIPKL